LAYLSWRSKKGKWPPGHTRLDGKTGSRIAQGQAGQGAMDIALNEQSRPTEGYLLDGHPWCFGQFVGWFHFATQATDLNIPIPVFLKQQQIHAETAMFFNILPLFPLIHSRPAQQNAPTRGAFCVAERLQ
jgi:hypothetical protein